MEIYYSAQYDVQYDINFLRSMDLAQI